MASVDDQDELSQQEPDPSDAMAEFKAGTRAATVMDRIAKGFGPSETDAIAAWWSRRR